ncbi:hypothetical protein [Streptomyces sp. IB201691-2A2]|jgi:hypothetical protein|uniref:hypothetical protein n=1 Tax=Streptomyces sp. IB201691-2A2 TaxID=2561920 RepID=UPI001180D67B|nr:hypothetical protein [Streptomyces sp. IB201691-2A2]TRO56457.1 hypothetical protein E4K73_46390 [Streptomyces sp. IB201691-2A2]
MTVKPCPRNHADACHAADGSVLCVSCIGQAERTLRALPALHQECLLHASPTSRRSNPTKVSGSRTRDHLNLSVLDARYSSLTALESWSQTVAALRKVTAPARSVPRLARFLVQHLEWLLAQPYAAEFADEMESVAAELRSTIDPGSGELRTAIRTCVVDNCSGTISTSLGSGAGARTGPLECSMGHAWEIGEWLNLRHLMEHQRKGADA